MPELRRDPLIGHWVAISPERGKRPSDYRVERSAPPPQRDPDCPFCPGNEQTTPAEIARVTGEDGTWRVRVVPNKFPALNHEPLSGRQRTLGLYERMNGTGAHEVVIESRSHGASLPELPLEQIETILSTYVARFHALAADGVHRHILVFKNHGKNAGASLAHPHSQIIGTPVVPREVAERLRAATAYTRQTGRCYLCTVLDKETRHRERIVEETEDYVVLSPYASRFQFETHIVPRVHGHDFADVGTDQCRSLARALRQTLTRLTAVLGDPSYNLVIRTAPLLDRLSDFSPAEVARSIHWHIEILPRLSQVAGFEWGTGIHINPIPPEDAAGALREVSC
jgi:UDPglucose--hexose-1-phosphate uridylyltransferase